MVVMTIIYVLVKKIIQYSPLILMPGAFGVVKLQKGIFVTIHERQVCESEFVTIVVREKMGHFTDIGRWWAW